MSLWQLKQEIQNICQHQKKIDCAIISWVLDGSGFKGPQARWCLLNVFPGKVVAPLDLDGWKMAIPAWKTARYPERLIFDPQIIVPLRPQLFKCETVAHSLCITYTTHHQEAAKDTVALIRSSLDNEELFLAISWTTNGIMRNHSGAYPARTHVAGAYIINKSLVVKTLEQYSSKSLKMLPNHTLVTVHKTGTKLAVLVSWCFPLLKVRICEK